jgi:anti-anti-sigma regulatory factor
MNLLHRGPLKMSVAEGIQILTITWPHLLADDQAQCLHRALRRAIRRARGGPVIVDWRNVKFLSGAVLGPVRAVQQALSKRRGWFVFRGLSPRVAQLFRLAGVIRPGDPGAALGQVADDGCQGCAAGLPARQKAGAGQTETIPGRIGGLPVCVEI